jgi:hypothetical protein
MMPDPWIFGWSQLLTMIGFVITICIALGGFRTFGRWKREKIEEKKIEIAFEALSIAYEAKFIFDVIRSPMSFAYEWEDMPRNTGESDQNWSDRGSFYAILKRIERNKDYFDRLWKLQPRFMAMFGPETESIFLLLHQARRFIEVSAQMLGRKRDDSEQWNENRQRLRQRMEADVWIGMDEVLEGDDVIPDIDRVSSRLRRFRDEMVSLCRPIVDREFKPM